MIEINYEGREWCEFHDSVRIFRTELLTTYGCGNKQFKLKKNIAALRQNGSHSVLTFGGVWSNHLHAFAIACEEAGLISVAAVRGEEKVSNELLDSAVKHGLKVHYLTRADYRLRNNDEFVAYLASELGCDSYLPEGGSNQLAVSGCRALAVSLNKAAHVVPDTIVLAVGTGATMAGIVCGAKPGQHVIGIPVVQDERLPMQIQDWIASEDTTTAKATWKLLSIASPARYAKVDQSLLEFVVQFHERTGVILDPVYNGKALRALLTSGIVDTISNNTVFVHTGGIGGCLGFAEQLVEAVGVAKAARFLTDARSFLNI